MHASYRVVLYRCAGWLAVQVVEEAAKKSPGNVDLDDEVARAREDLCVALREKDEAEAEQKLSEAQQHHAFFVKVHLTFNYQPPKMLNEKTVSTSSVFSVRVHHFRVNAHLNSLEPGKVSLKRFQN